MRATGDQRPIRRCGIGAIQRMLDLLSVLRAGASLGLSGAPSLNTPCSITASDRRAPVGGKRVCVSAVCHREPRRHQTAQICRVGRPTFCRVQLLVGDARSGQSVAMVSRRLPLGIW